ncbi:MFS transporter [Luteipulveratus sp. YIM 133132]|uniref:MFS transporter n=1 Tax=Luteipulveratus flavus TaxID=3031728 RepID=UPI0023B1085F|nr:MFS transporter [Luteipulveratus sp. YIM 133132]MDE9366712.1 MFS transporter [Luteipulveratus sp. YIM 133132]
MRTDEGTQQRSAADPTDVAVTSRAVYATFALNGAAFATWASRIPDVKAGLGLSSQQLGLLLLAMSLGAVVGLPLSGRIAAALGVRRAVLLGASAATVGVGGAGLAVALLESAPVAAVGMFIAGLAIGIWDVAMNLEGAHVEHQLGRSIMPRYHAAFSGGTVLSALIGAGASAAGVSVGVHLPVMLVLILGAMLLTSRGFRLVASADTDDEPEDAAGRSAWREPRTLLIGLVTLVAAFTEGTANDWLSVAFVEGHELPSWAGVLAFAVFLTAMTLGRLAGTALLDRHGRVPVLRVMFVAAAAGSLLVVFGGTPLAYAGAAVWGVGVALGFPVGMSAASDDPRRAHARMSVVATIGYTAFIAGPPLLGFLGEHVGVLHALLAVGAGILLALACLPAVREPEPAAAPTP